MMNLLAIDTSTEQASVALYFNGLMYSAEQGSQKTHAQVVLPMLDELLERAKARLSDFDALVFGCGPGSFTGLRITCSIAKGLAYAHDLNLIPVSSLTAITWAARKELNDNKLPVLSVLDARMHEMYWGLFRSSDYAPAQQVSAAGDIAVDEDSALIIAGVGIDTYWHELPQAIKEKISQKLTIFPSASAMIELANTLVLPAVSVTKAQPIYIRNRVTQGDSRG